MAIGLLDLSSFLFTRILLLRLLPEAAQRAPEPRRPAQPRPHTRRSHHIAHAEGRRIGRHQRPTSRARRGMYGAHEFYTLPNPVANLNLGA